MKLLQNGINNAKIVHIMHIIVILYLVSKLLSSFSFCFVILRHCLLYTKIQKNKKVAIKFTRREILPFKLGETPSKYTWHHHQDKGVMQLVDRQIHESVRHDGGYSIWGNR